MNNLKNNCLNFLLKIVSTKSLSKNEMAVSEIVAKEMRTLKYDDVKIDKLGNVVGVIGNGRKKILYDAHIDTVGVSDIKQWRTEPFKATLKNGVIYGRGSCDDKGCVASMVHAGGLIKKLGLLGDFTLYVSASVQEETADGHGIEFVLKNLRYRPDCVVIGEPSDLKIVRGHKGRAEMKVTINGKACHASTPEKGENAIYGAVDFVKKIELLNKKYSRLKKTQLGRPVISVTQIETSNASVNTIPDNCSLYIDRRTVEGETKKQIERELEKICGPAFSRIKVVYQKKFLKAWVLPEEHNLVRAAEIAYRKTFNSDADVLLWPFCTNGSFTMGERKIPTIGFGPGEPKYAHIANEQIKFSDVLSAIKFYSIFPLTFSGGGLTTDD